MLTVKEIVARYGGVLHASHDRQILGIASLEHARATHISFLTNPKFRSLIATTQAGALILAPADFAILQTEIPQHVAVIVAENPYLYYAHISVLFKPESNRASAYIHATAQIDPTAQIAEGVTIEPYVVIGPGCKIGQRVYISAGCVLNDRTIIEQDTYFHPHVVVYAGCHIGQRCIIHSGAVIGADGFGFANDQGKWVKITQLGAVWIGNDVEIGANTTIDRGAIDDTVIEDGVKLDNQIQIGHNVCIGAHSALAGCVGVAGSTQIGKYCMIGGSAMILGHLELADGVVISAGTLISRSIHQPGMYTGIYPFQKNAAWEKSAAIIRQLPDMRQRLKVLQSFTKKET